MFFYPTIFQHITVPNSTVWFSFNSDCHKVVQPNIYPIAVSALEGRCSITNEFTHKNRTAYSSLMHEATMCSNPLDTDNVRVIISMDSFCIV